ncbi:tripartite tricarboxylate transporter permease, partial [Candidatus Pacearchaeota archaeon]|nr:tripartite tricarboxylate transporter permease [Candidatus Pacearchaeota archaeon]
MLLEFILFLLAGIFFGTFTGLTPGIHINLIGGLLISLPLLNLNPIYFVIFVTAMAITHTFLDFVPSVFLGCPDTDTELSILPGHQLLKDARGFEAVYLSNIGSLLAIFLLVIISIPSIFLMKDFYELISSVIPYILILVL